jgi:hypothetical protein
MLSSGLAQFDDWGEAGFIGQALRICFRLAILSPLFQDQGRFDALIAGELSR